jgi:hypothetical protein
MAPTHPAPNTTSMLSVASFPGTSGMRQQPLGTIMETPSLAQDTTVVYTQVSSAPMASQARFQNVESTSRGTRRLTTSRWCWVQGVSVP